MKLRRYLVAVLASTPAAFGLHSVPPAVADCTYSGGSSVCADGEVRGPDGEPRTDSYPCSDEYRNSEEYRNGTDYRLCVDDTWDTWTVAPPPVGPVGPGGPVGPVVPIVPVGPG